MGNPFMPSVATSLNQAGGMTLQSLLEQRLVQQEMAAQQQKLQQQALMDQMSLGLRLRGDQRAQGTADLTRQRFVFDQEQDRAKAKAAQLKADAEAREARNVAGARDIFATGVQNGADPRDLTRAALDGKVPVSMMPKPEEDPVKRLARIKAEAQARAEGSSAGKPPKAAKGVKPVKDNPSLPTGFKRAIQNRVGSTGFETKESALKAIKDAWPKWRANYPSLDWSMVKSEIDNVYSGNIDDGFVLPAGDAKAAAQGRAAQAKSLHR